MNLPGWAGGPPRELNDVYLMVGLVACPFFFHQVPDSSSAIEPTLGVPILSHKELWLLSICPHWTRHNIFCLGQKTNSPNCSSYSSIAHRAKFARVGTRQQVPGFGGGAPQAPPSPGRQVGAVACGSLGVEMVINRGGDGGLREKKARGPGGVENRFASGRPNNDHRASRMMQGAAGCQGYPPAPSLGGSSSSFLHPAGTPRGQPQPMMWPLASIGPKP